MDRGLRWVIGVVAVVGAIVAVVVSRHTSSATVSRAVERPSVAAAGDLPVLDAGPAPSVEQVDAWLNTNAVNDADLRGKVVLYDFWTFGCVNCQHTLPHVKAWQLRYAPDGLAIISIHTPEFAYEADRQNVADYVTEHGITYPVLLDPQRRVWNTWDNHYWPAFYLYDRQGRLRVRHFGEGSYMEMEQAIRVLLDVAPSSPPATVTA